MIVSGHFVDIDFRQGLKACFVTDDNQPLYVMTNIPSVYDQLLPELITDDISRKLCLLELKEIEKTHIDIQNWYILEAMVFGD